MNTCLFRMYAIHLHQQSNKTDNYKFRKNLVIKKKAGLIVGLLLFVCIYKYSMV